MLISGLKGLRLILSEGNMTFQLAGSEVTTL